MITQYAISGNHRFVIFIIISQTHTFARAQHTRTHTHTHLFGYKYDCYKHMILLGLSLFVVWYLRGRLAYAYKGRFRQEIRPT